MANQTTAQQNEDRFSLAMRGARDGLWDWNLETDEVYYSPRWSSMLGYEEDEIAASIDTWASLVHPDDREYVLKKVQDYISRKKRILKSKCVCATKMGTGCMFSLAHF